MNSSVNIFKYSFCQSMFQIGKNPMQSPGAYAIVNAIKNNPESALKEIELTVRLKKQKEDSVFIFLLLQMSHHLMFHLGGENCFLCT